MNSCLSFPILTFLFLTILHQSSLIFFYLLINHNTRLSISISPFLSHSMPHVSTSIFFYLFVNLNSRLSSSISPFLSHSILHLSTSIFFYLLANLVDAYLPITNFKLSFHLTLSLLTTKDQSTTKIFYILFL